MIRKDRRTRKWQKHAYLFASTTLLLGKTRSNAPIFATTRRLKCDTPIWFVPPGKQKKKKGSLIQIQNHSHTSEKRERRNRAPRGVEFHERALCSTIPTSKARRVSIRENKRSVFMHIISIIIGGKFSSNVRLKKTRGVSTSDRFAHRTFPLSRTCASKSPSVRSTAPAFAPVMASKPTKVRDFFMPNISSRV